MTDFARYLKALMDKRGIGPEAFARELGVHRRIVYKWRSGEATPEGPNVIKLMRALNGDLEHAFTLIGNRDIEQAGEEDAHLFMHVTRPPRPDGGRRR